MRPDIFSRRRVGGVSLPGAPRGLGAGDDGLAAPDKGMRAPKLARLPLCGGVAQILVPGLRLGRRPDEGGDEYEFFTCIPRLEDAGDARGRLGRAVFDKPRQPAPPFAVGEYDLVATVGGDTDRLADHSTEVVRFDEKEPPMALHCGERGGQ